MENKQKSSQIKHSSLTRLFRRRWDLARDTDLVSCIMNKCNVSPIIGSLPPALCRRVPRDEIAARTVEFNNVMRDFLHKNYKKLTDPNQYMIFELPQMGRLFDTECIAECDGLYGKFGFVIKISFPLISQSYAVKLFYRSGFSHGANFEIPVAFAANHAEPRHNVPVYMGNFSYGGPKYMLSEWAGNLNVPTVSKAQDSDSVIIDRSAADQVFYRDNKNVIFDTTANEEGPRNYGHGRRLDYGKTYVTLYGLASYRVRKIYRQIMSAADNGDIQAFHKILVDNSSYVNRRDIMAGMKLAVTCNPRNTSRILETIRRDFMR